MQYKEVRVKDLDRHAIEALLVSRALPVKIKRDIENQIRGLLENLGLVIGQAKMKLKRQPISATTRSIAPLRSERGMSPAPHEPRLSIGIDTSGTFTDIVAVDGSSGAMAVTKVASTPANPAIGLVRGVREILDAAGASANDVAGQTRAAKLQISGVAAARWSRNLLNGISIGLRSGEHCDR